MYFPICCIYNNKCIFLTDLCESEKVFQLPHAGQYDSPCHRVVYVVVWVSDDDICFSMIGTFFLFRGWGFSDEPASPVQPFVHRELSLALWCEKAQCSQTCDLISFLSAWSLCWVEVEVGPWNQSRGLSINTGPAVSQQEPGWKKPAETHAET